MKQDLLKELSEEQIAKVKACKTHEEILNLAKIEGVELTSEQLNAINGGCGSCTMPEEWYMDCPYCAAGRNTLVKIADDIYECQYCGKIYRPSKFK